MTGWGLAAPINLVAPLARSSRLPDSPTRRLPDSVSPARRRAASGRRRCATIVAQNAGPGRRDVAGGRYTHEAALAGGHVAASLGDSGSDGARLETGRRDPSR